MLNSFATTQVMISEVVLKIDSVDSMNISPRLNDAQNKKKCESMLTLFLY